MRPPRNPESGFALLFVYAMAATVAIMLYMEIPRVAFEAQRDKEQLLIDRGEQYSRAVTLYVRKFNKYPADFDALQSTQNLRFLRHKYTDPMTGKDDWRLVHVGPGGVFTDSLVYGKKKDGKQTDQQNFITELQQTGGNQASGNEQGVNIGTRQRPSDQPGAPGDPNNPNQTLQAGMIQPGMIQPGTVQPGLPQPGLVQSGLPQFDANGQPIPNTANIQPGVPGQFQPGLNGPAGGFPPGALPAPGQPFPGQQFPGQQFPGQQFPGQQQPGQPPVNPPTSAAGLINQILTSPRPGGLNGLGGIQQGGIDQNGNVLPNVSPQGTTTSTLGGGSAGGGSPVPAAAAQSIIGGGLAGVASKTEIEGIKIYKEQTAYNKWEFVYDISKDPTRSAVAPVAAPAQGTGTPASGNANPAPNGAPGLTGIGGSNAPPPPPQPPATPTQQ